MNNQKSPQDCDPEQKQRQEGLIQEKPSHMNQGSEAFLPDQQRNQSPDERRKNQKNPQPQQEPSRKAS